MADRPRAARPVANPLRRNVAIIAHVDHGKTTLVDALLHQSGVFRANERVAERALDNTDLERERGITILAKNTAVHYDDVLINIVDTPGHADFGGEVERTLAMVDGVLLLVDASEGPLPQTRFVLRKALERRLPALVVHQQDRPPRRAGRPRCSTRSTTCSSTSTPPRTRSTSRSSTPTRRRARRAPTRRPRGNRSSRCSTRSCATCRLPPAMPAPRSRCWWPTSTRATTSAASRSAASSTGRVALGDEVAVCKLDGGRQRTHITKLFAFDGLPRVEVDSAAAGDIICLAGIEGITIGETVTDPERPRPIPPIHVDEPTVSMIFGVNTSPMAGRSGQYVTSRHLRDRLARELVGNVSIRVEETDSPEQLKVVGRGELQLSILIEMMRREGYELQVSRPEIVTRTVERPGAWSRSRTW